jgi:hypothetical protein
MGAKLRDVLAHVNDIICHSCIVKRAFRKQVTTNAESYTSMITGVVAMMSGESV